MQAQWPPAPYVGIWTRTTSPASGARARARAVNDCRDGDGGRSTSSRCATTRCCGGAQRDELPGTVGAGKAARAVGSCARRGRSGEPRGRARPPRARARAHRHCCPPRVARRPSARTSCTTTTASGMRAPRAIRRARRPGAARPTDARAEIFRRYLTAFGPASAGHPGVGDDARPGDHARARAARAAPPLPRRERPRAPRRRPRAAPRRQHPGAGSLPAQVGQRAARVGRSCTRAAGALPQKGDPRERRRGADVPRRRIRRRTWRAENGRVVVEPFALSRASKREVADEAERLEAFLKPS